MKVDHLTEEIGLTEKDEDSVRTTLNRYKGKMFTRLVDGSWGIFSDDKV
jgi:hypothetical protein